MDKKQMLYLRIANSIEEQIRNDILKIGDKLPSLRTICLEKRVSLSTASQAYLELESRGLIESKPQSGFYVSFAHKHFRAIPNTSQPVSAKLVDGTEEVFSAVYINVGKAEISMSSSLLSAEFLPIAKLKKEITNATRTLPDGGVHYERYDNQRLKRQIALRSFHWGKGLLEKDIITTSGCMDAITFCLLSLAKNGETIAVESPIHFNILHVAKNLGLNVLELPTNPVTGIEIEALKKAIERKKVKLCLMVSNFSNPLGSCMPEENKKAVVKLLEKNNVPLIEVDCFGDLYFGNQRPTCCKTYDESGMVLLCNSFSKTLAPGYRVGWVSAGKYHEQVARTKRYSSLYPNSITHEAVGSFLENNRYENHLKKLRNDLYGNSIQFLKSISSYFPEDAKVTRPMGGMHLWIELNKKADTVELYNKAILQKISIAPGRTYTLQNQYNNCFKLGFGMQWSEKLENALKLLGKLAHTL